MRDVASELVSTCGGKRQTSLRLLTLRWCYGYLLLTFYGNGKNMQICIFVLSTHSPRGGACVVGLGVLFESAKKGGANLASEK